MQKTPTVMNDLHRISDKIAENTRQTRETSVVENQWAAAPGESAPPPVPAQTSAPAPASAPSQTQTSAPAPVPAPVPRPVSAPSLIPSALLERRYADFLRIRRDLLERLTDMSAKLEKTEKNCTERLALTKDTLASVQDLLNTLPPEIPEKASFADRSELAENMLALEKLRLETIRLSHAVENETVPNASGSKKQESILLDSLTFRQIFRAAMFATLPFAIVLLIATLIIAVAVIGSFNGLF